MATFAKPENALKRAEGRSFDLIYVSHKHAIRCVEIL